MAIVLYFLANQTQVGWLYLIVDGLIGLLVGAFFYSRSILKPIRVTRGWRKEPGPPDDEDDPLLALPALHEDDPIEIGLQFSHHRPWPALLVGGREECPFAPPADRLQPLFIPALWQNRPVRLSYQTTCDRRGRYVFSPLALYSQGAFGLFRTRRQVSAPGDILIYPSYHPFRRFRSFERRELAERQTASLGSGTQVIGTREYRPGDPLRHVHWRSTARLGSLVVKEFSDDEQATLTVVLDLAADGNIGEGKYATFETAVRIAASLGYYAQQNSIPFYLVGDNRPVAGQKEKLALPLTPLGWWTVLNYLAKIENNGHTPLAKVLAEFSSFSFVVALVSRYDEAVGQALLALPQRGVQVLAILITPDGNPPAHVPLSIPAGLEIKTVSPFNWPALLGE